MFVLTDPLFLLEIVTRSIFLIYLDLALLSKINKKPKRKYSGFFVLCKNIAAIGHSGRPLPFLSEMSLE